LKVFTLAGHRTGGNSPAGTGLLQIDMVREHVARPSPKSIERDLHSSNE